MTNYVAYNLEASSSWQRQLRKLVPSLDPRVVQHADHLVGGDQVYSGQREARTFAVEDVVAG